MKYTVKDTKQITVLIWAHHRPLSSTIRKDAKWVLSAIFLYDVPAAFRTNPVWQPVFFYIQFHN